MLSLTASPRTASHHYYFRMEERISDSDGCGDGGVGVGVYIYVLVSATTYTIHQSVSDII